MSENWQATDDRMKTFHFSAGDPKTHTHLRPSHTLLRFLLSMLIGQQDDKKRQGTSLLGHEAQQSLVLLVISL